MSPHALLIHGLIKWKFYYSFKSFPNWKLPGIGLAIGMANFSCQFDTKEERT